MGVPHFVHWLVKRYPMIYRRMHWASRPKFDCFFIDFNCIIYGALRQTKTIEGDNGREIINEVLRFVDTLVQVVRPTSLIFISVDGPAPLAKCVHQRSRRFLRARKSAEESVASTQISVGTEFMEKLHNQLMDFISERVKNDTCWKTPTVVYSSHRTPGEGEHKFFDFIRQQRKFWNNDACCCVYSPDADLVIVCLQSRIKNFYVIRESEQGFPEIEIKGTKNDSGIRYSFNDFMLISINLLRDYLSLDFGEQDDRLLDDFSFLTYLIGNDFIPNFPDIKIEKGHFSVVVDLYKEKYFKQKKYLVKGLKFHKKNLAEFLKDAAITVGMLNNNYKSPKDLLNKAEENFMAKLDDDEIYTFEELKKKMSFSILESFHWVLQYYKNGVPSWTWHYPYYFAPSLLFVSDYVNEFECDFIKGSPPLPFVQLLSILPPGNRDLLPKALQPLMDQDSPIYNIYPTEFRKTKRGSEDFAILPFVDISKVHDAFLTVSSGLTKEENERNKIIHPYCFSEKGCEIINYSHKIVNFHVYGGSNTSCIPSLFFFNIKPTVVSYPKPGKSEVMILSFSIPFSSNNANKLENKTILVGWPYFVPALVERIYRFNSQQDLITDYRKIYGLDISNTSFIARAHFLQFGDIYEYSIQWSNRANDFPMQHTAPIPILNTIQRFNLPTTLEPREGQLSVITRGKNQNKLCKIMRILNRKSFELLEIPRPNYDNEIQDLIKQDRKYWIPIETVAKRYKLSKDLLLKVLTDLHTQNHPTNIALPILKQNKGIEGFCKNIGNNLHVTQSVIDCLDSYFNFTDTLLMALQVYESNKDDGSILDDCLNEFFDVYGDERATSIKDWVKANSPSHNFPYKKLYQPSLSQETITKIEELFIQGKSEISKKASKLHQPRENVTWYGKNIRFNNKPFIGYPAYTIAPSGVIPFGTYGYIVSLSNNNQLAHLIAVEPFSYGSRMKGCIKTNRGFIIPSNHLVLLKE